MPKKSKTAIAAERKRLNLKRAEKILSLFADANGRPPISMEELTNWSTSPDGKRYLDSFRDKKTGHMVPD
jgi:hypothetical protein